MAFTKRNTSGYDDALICEAQGLDALRQALEQADVPGGSGAQGVSGQRRCPGHDANRELSAHPNDPGDAGRRARQDASAPSGGLRMASGQLHRAVATTQPRDRELGRVFCA